MENLWGHPRFGTHITSFVEQRCSLLDDLYKYKYTYIYIYTYICNLRIKYALRSVICKTLVIACFKIVAGFILRFMAKRNRI